MLPTQVILAILGVACGAAAAEEPKNWVPSPNDLDSTTANTTALIEKIKANLAASLTKVNQDNPPFLDVNRFTEWTCASDFFSCDDKTAFWNRKYLRWVDNVTIKEAATSSTSFFNPGKNVLQFKKVMSTANTLGTTRGWTIGSKIGGKITAPPAEISSEISSSYKDETAESTTRTDTEEFWGQCPPGKNCRFLTYTFQATIRGKCISDPFMSCGAKKINVCPLQLKGQLKEECGQKKAFGEKFNDHCQLASAEPCAVRVQFRSSPTELLKQIVLDYD